MKEMINYINNSNYRAKVIMSLGDDLKFPSTIDRETNIPQNQVSAVLRGFVDKGIAEIVNPEVRKGRYYRLTEYGLNILGELQ